MTGELLVEIESTVANLLFNPPMAKGVDGEVIALFHQFSYKQFIHVTEIGQIPQLQDPCPVHFTNIDIFKFVFW